MIDVRPLVIAYHNSRDDDEKELIQSLARDAALNKQEPVIFFESGDAMKFLSPPALQALNAVVISVKEHREKLDLALVDSKKQGWALVCALPAANTELAAGSGRRRRVSVEGKGKAKVEGRSRPERPRVCKLGYGPYPTGLRTAILRSLSGNRHLVSDSSSSEDEHDVDVGKGKSKMVKMEQVSDDDSDSLQILGFGPSSGSGGAPLIVLSSDDDADADEMPVEFPPHA